jgi:hypothetical protein
LSSSSKRPKLEPFDEEPIPWDLGGHGPEGPVKRQTLVCDYSP